MVQGKVRDGRLDVEVPDNEVNGDEHLYHVLPIQGEVSQVKNAVRVQEQWFSLFSSALLQVC